MGFKSVSHQSQCFELTVNRFSGFCITLTENNNSFTSINKHLLIRNLHQLQFISRTHGPIGILFLMRLALTSMTNSFPGFFLNCGLSCGLSLRGERWLLTAHQQELVTLKEACKYELPSVSDGLLLNPVKFKTFKTLGDWSFVTAAPQLWNSLPYAVRSSPSLASFKKALKTFLFQKAFSWFCVLFDLVLSRFYAIFYDFSSLVNF